MTMQTTHVYVEVADDTDTEIEQAPEAAPAIVEILVGGMQGVPGKSAYEIAVENGFVGTEADWLATFASGTDPEVVRDTMATALVAGSNVTITPNDGANTITIAATDTNTTDPEVVRDTIAAALVAGSGVTITPNDGADTITITATGSYSDENARDAIGAALVAGARISIVVNDAGDTITISSNVEAMLPLDEPPVTPHAKDDEFPGTSLDAKWAIPITSAANCGTSATVQNGKLSIEPSTTGSVTINQHGAWGIRQAAPTGSFTVSAKFRDQFVGGDDSRTGLWVANATNAYLHGPCMVVPRIYDGVICTYSETANWGNSAGGPLTIAGLNLGWLWVKLSYDAPTQVLTYWYSTNGVKWRLGGTQNAVSQPTKIGLGLWANTAMIADHDLAIDWFRVTEP